MLLSDGKEMDVQQCCNVDFWKGFCHFRFICLGKTRNEASDLHINHQRGIGLQSQRAVLEILVGHKNVYCRPAVK